MESLGASELVAWFQSQNGTLDSESMGIVTFRGQGRGAIALKNIPEDHVLFSFPRDLTLSTRTSTLPLLMGDAWKAHGLHEGWAGLILCMMWEESRSAESKWSGYLAALPQTFDTPMFWPEEDLKELQGTAVVDKIGRGEAERDYHEKLVPAIKSRLDLFPEQLIPQYFTPERYHLNGSRILSRSFHVEKWKREHGEEDDNDDDAAKEPGNDSAMDIDVPEATESAPQPPPPEIDAEREEPDAEEVHVEGFDEDSDDEDREDPADVAMVPIADMLNARFESENAKLFYEEHELKMMSTRPIKIGEQIWNTYGDPPNSDLLRRYGHVDLVPLRPPLKGVGNPEDVVEVRADLVVKIASKRVKHNLQERVDWWLEEADDDVFVLRTGCQLPDEFVSFERLLLLPKDDKLPKPKADKESIVIAIEALEMRMEEYATSIEEDEQLLEPRSVNQLSVNKKNAVIVRLGEKRILRGAIEQLRLQLESFSKRTTKKRSREEEKDGKGKKAKI
ncbi:SET domain-containing protein [Epithele typhae]|uniref:SET domain-containing protein n=1 Tax=Epithele typhae TaxID=378194 RepID=UPI0020082BA1|nr:SET domain-containing protein [Epithele typhae]KAH9929577.1 SET domain-containing protein [Epithele typhae]